MRFVCLSDTHCHRDIEVPDGDVLIHAGDATMIGNTSQVAMFAAWMRRLPHQHKIFVAGNHDWLFEKNASFARSLMRDANVTYLQDSRTNIDGVSIYGTPWTPWFNDWAFNLRTEAELRRNVDKIPEGTDILVTHGPPCGIMDMTLDGSHVGCRHLLRRVREVKPKAHVFGHIHFDYGYDTDDESATFINASVCDESYKPVNKPIVFEYSKGDEHVVIQ